MSKDDVPENPRAFPHESSFDGRKGMTLRDWFAGQALAGFTSCCMEDGDAIMGAADTAKAAYNYADAMLRARLTNAGTMKGE